MKIRRTTRIAIQIEQEWTIRARSSSFECWCGYCGHYVQFIAWEEAAAMAAVSSGILRSWVDQGRLHPGETPAGSSLICLSSLVKQIYDNANQKDKSQWNEQSET